MGYFTAILGILKSWLGWKAADAANFNSKRLEELSHEADQLRLDIMAAARAGNDSLVSILQDKLTSNDTESKTLRATSGSARG